MREMKDSGIAWIGAMPRAWKMNTIAQIFLQVKCKNTGLQEKNLLSLSYGKVKRKSIDTVEGLLPESFDGYNIIEKDDIVLRLTDLQNDHTSLRVGLAEERGIITSAYLTIRNRSNFCPKYLYYYLHSFDIAKGFYGMGAGVRQGLNWDGIKWLKILAPSVPEQERIAAFLDAECAEIDTVLEKTRASIEEYKKLKQAVITQAVTKGIRGDMPMKDSGIEWIGEIPEGWEIIPVKYLAKYNYATLAESCSPDFEFSYIDIGSVTYTDGITNYQNFKFKDAPSRARRIVHSGDILVSTVRTYLRAVACVNEHRLPQIASTGFLVLQADTSKIHPHFLMYSVLSDNFICKVEANSVGISYPAINASQIVHFKLPIPQLSEQFLLVTYLDRQCSEIDALLSKNLSSIEDYKKLKQAVITQAVTKGVREG